MPRQLFRMMVLAALTALLASCSGATGAPAAGADAGPADAGDPLALTIHYRRPAADYTDWGLHLWNDTDGPPALADSDTTYWTSPHPFSEDGDGWVAASLHLLDAHATLHFLVHRDDVKSPDADFAVTRASSGPDVWVAQDIDALAFSRADADALAARVGHQADSLDLSPVSVGDAGSALPEGWNRSAHFMEIFVRSYADSDGDGKGDLKGLISRLDYLQSLGVTGLWLMPIYKSQDHDHGYSVLDYRSVESDYGTLADLDTLVTEAHRRGIGIILDYVMNHAAVHNPLFLDALSGSTNPRYHWFLFSPSDPGWTGWSGASWHLSELGYFYGVFGSDLPDFNLKNPAVVAWHLDNLRFWLNRGVDGFRLDAASSFVENGINAWEDQPESHAILKQVQDALSAYSNRYLVCEAPDAPSDYAQPTSCGNAFAFGHQWDLRSTATGTTLTAGLVNYLQAPNRAHMPLILSNHDSFAGDRPYAQLHGRAEGDYRVAAALELLGSDTPFSLYGEEVGEANDPLGGDPGIRAPMSWTADTVNGGFTSGVPYRQLSANVADHNVASELGATGSLLETYRALYAVRNAYPVLESGALDLRSHEGDSSVIFLRTLGNQTAVVLINLSPVPQTLSAQTGIASTGFTAVFPAGGSTVTSDSGGQVSAMVPGQGVVILLAP